MKSHPVLAKSLRDPKSPPRLEETLMGHTFTVLESFRIIFGCNAKAPTRLALCWLSFFKLSKDDFAAFYINALAACGLHDPGKANNGFQDMVARRKGVQSIRHEHLSALLLWLPPIAEWLDSVPLADRRIVFSAVVGHHLRARAEDFAEPLDTDVKSFLIYPDAILEILDRLAHEMETPSRPLGLIESLWSFDEDAGFDLSSLRDQIKKSFRRFNRELRANPKLNRVLIAVRAALILADSSGSAMAREGKDMKAWLKSAFDGELNRDYVLQQIIEPRIRQIVLKEGSFTWSDFQNAAEGLPDRALLLAPCGSGKTLAAWRWIKARLDDRPVSRIIFLYPTRATATEGFHDYVSWAPESDASLATGTASYELAGMFENVEDDRRSKDFTTEDRLYALGFWHRRVFSATVDQFFGFMQQTYRSVCLTPLLADSVVVVDEAHSFDPSLFSALKLFLKNFNVPVLCMTATLPAIRRSDLTEGCGLEVFPKSTEAFPDLETCAAMPRYLIHRLDGEDAAEQIALEALNAGKRVLWVVNKVARCQRLAKNLKALCYHSRFKLEDRKQRHTEVVSAFKNSPGPILAVTTQVCEMSLDLDAELLISETAPITSIIQRLGRLNRHARPGSERIGEAFFYPPQDDMPYSLEDLAGRDAFLDVLEGKTASQSQLEELLEKYGPAEIERENYSAFLEDGPWAHPRELRDIADFTVNALLDSDVPRYFELLNQQKEIDGLLLPVPRQHARPHPRLGKFPLVAKSTHYHPEYGFFDHPLEEII